jgi:ubiquinone/menaquinone biosynthesis C-methylase UbiE
MWGLLGAWVYDRSLFRAEAACLADWRRELLAGAKGDALEIGAGTGANLPHYPSGVHRLVLAEPNAGMRARLKRKVGERTDVTVIDATAEVIPLPDRAFDVVVSTFVLCSVDSPGRSLAEAWRVLRPGGRLLFLEHVAAENRPGRLRWQRLLEPAWRCVAGNCHLTRHTEAAITEMGFHLEDVRRESIRKVAGVVRPSIRGVGRRPFAPS